MYCDVGMCEIEDLMEADAYLEAYNNRLQLLEKGHNILPSQIMSIINWGLDSSEMGYCFCKIKKIGWKHRFERHYTKSTVYLYASNLDTIEEFIGQVSGFYFSIKYSGVPDEFLQPVPKGEYFKIGISYKELLPYLIDTLKEMIENIKDYRDEYLEIG
jgi:hypothetical protein